MTVSALPRAARPLLDFIALLRRNGFPVAPEQAPSLLSQAAEDAAAKSAGCQTCHTSSDEPTMHASRAVRLGCTDCHGGDAGVRAAGMTDVDVSTRIL